MSLQKVIRPHYSKFSEMVNPVALASHLDSLTMSDRNGIECQAKSWGCHYAISALVLAINSKVCWEELHKALLKEKYLTLANILQDEYYKQNPSAHRMLNHENLDSRTPKSDMKHGEYKSELPRSDEIPSKDHLNDEVAFNGYPCNEGSTTSKSNPRSPAPAVVNMNIRSGQVSILQLCPAMDSANTNITIIYNGNVSNCPVQIGDQNKIVSEHDVSEQNVNVDDTSYEVVEVLCNQDLPEIEVQRSPSPQKLSGGRSIAESVTSDKLMSDLVSKDNSFRSPACEKVYDYGDQKPLKTLARPGNECSLPCVGEMTAVDNNASSTSKPTFHLQSRNSDGTSVAEEFGIELRQSNGKNEGGNYSNGDEEEETHLKQIAPID